VWGSWVRRKGTTQVMYNAKLKDGPKKSYKNLLNDLEKIFKRVWWRGRKWNHIKRIFKVEVFFSSQNIDFPFYLKRLLELFSLFFNTFYSPLSLFLYASSLEDLGILIILEEKNHFFKNFFSNEMVWSG
jgi:hypothetical protein